MTFLPIFLITFGVFVVFFLAMGIGYLIQKKPLKGSCGGVAAMMGDEQCQFCGGDVNKCQEISDTQANNQNIATLGKKA